MFCLGKRQVTAFAVLLILCVSSASAEEVLFTEKSRGLPYPSHSKPLTEQQIERSKTEFWLATEKGEAHSQYNIGSSYDIGYGVERDFVEAAKWYQKAAEQGQWQSQYRLYAFYLNGIGVEQSDRKAFELLKQLVEETGFAEPLTDLGSMYKTARGVAKNDEKAVELYERAIQKGLGTKVAHYNLALMYDNGWGVVKDNAVALEHYKNAAFRGIGRAVKKLAEMAEVNLDAMDANKEVTEEDFETAFNRCENKTREHRCECHKENRRFYECNHDNYKWGGVCYETIMRSNRC